MSQLGLNDCVSDGSGVKMNINAPVVFLPEAIEIRVAALSLRLSLSLSTLRHFVLPFSTASHC